ncbi:MAG: hypothetical protein ACFB11_00910 [Paracoccaceae bacterium]
MAGLKGFLASTTIVVALAGGAQVSFPDLGNEPSSGFSAPLNTQWDVTAVPSPNGIEAEISLSGLPVQIDEYVEAFQYRVNGGTPRTLRYGRDLTKTHPILLATGLNDLVELRAMYTNMDDRITRTPGDWSEPKSISGQIGQPVIEIEDVRAKYGAPSTAPVTAQFKARARGFETVNPEHRLHFQWDFGDPGSTHRRADAIQTLVHGNDANVGFEWMGGHAYWAPGDYTVTCTVTDGLGNQYVGSYTYSVADPDVVFAGSRTICVMPSGATTGGPDGCLYRTSLSGAKSSWTSNSGRYRLLIERGYSYSFKGQFNSPLELHVGPIGTGANPIVDSGNDNGLDGGERGWCFYGLDCIGPYDPANPGTSRPPNFFDRIVQNSSFMDMEFRGWAAAFSPAQGQSMHMAGVFVTDWHNYAVDATGGTTKDSCFVGVTFAQNPNAISTDDSYGTTGGIYYPDHGPIRSNRTGGDWLFSNFGGFSNNSHSHDEAQGIIRWNAQGIGTGDLVATQSVIEDPGLYIGATAGNAGSEYCNGKISKSHIIVGNSAAGGMFSCPTGGVVFENVIAVRPVNGRTGRGVLFAAGETATNNYVTYNFQRNRPDKSMNNMFPPYFRNCTFADEGNSDTDGKGTWRYESLTGHPSFERRNCIEYAPNVGARALEPGGDYSNSNDYTVPVPFGNDTGIDATTETFTPRSLGRRILGENNDQLQTEFSNAGAGKKFKSLPGGSGVAAATGVLGEDIALDDFYGVLRRVTKPTGALDRGPFQLAA